MRQSSGRPGFHRYKGRRQELGEDVHCRERGRVAHEGQVDELLDRAASELSPYRSYSCRTLLVVGCGDHSTPTRRRYSRHTATARSANKQRVEIHAQTRNPSSFDESLRRDAKAPQPLLRRRKTRQSRTRFPRDATPARRRAHSAAPNSPPPATQLRRRDTSAPRRKRSRLRALSRPEVELGDLFALLRAVIICAPRLRWLTMSKMPFSLFRRDRAASARPIRRWVAARSPG